jgi:leucyl aminopeptidase (aminopeptidase T)
MVKGVNSMSTQTKSAGGKDRVKKTKHPTKQRVSSALKKAAMTACSNCLAVKPGEFVLVLTDINKRAIGYALWEAAREIGSEAMVIEMLPRSSNGEEPPQPIAELMGLVNVCLCPTTKSVTHTDSRRAATAKGVRVATLPGITEDMMIRCLNADYARISDLSSEMAYILTEAKSIRVMTPKGTDIVLPVEGRRAKADTGLIHKPGDYGNLPAGEAFIAPLEGRSNGVFVVDGAMAGLGKLKKGNIKITVRDGYASDITGGKEAERLVTLLDMHGREARNVAEFGVGTNYKARLTGLILEDEKVLGTVHIAFGDNASMGGNVRVSSHLDGLMRKPTVEVDGRLVMKEGKILV